MLEHLGFSEAAKDVEKAVEQDLLTRGTAKRSTAEVGTAIAALVK
jgi:3-isopropylmalate dehydrogenase